MLENQNNLDTAQGVFFQRELEHVKDKTYDIAKAPLRAFELIPVDNSTDAAAESIVYQQYDMVGVAKVISSYADDLPRADVKGKEFVAQVKSVGNSYGYNLQEIRAAAKAGKPLEQRKANSALYAQQREWNSIAFYGLASHNLPGWLTNANIPVAAAPADGTSNGTTFKSKTPAQIVRDLNELVNGIVKRTKQAERPNTLALPIDIHSYIHSTTYGQASDDSIAQVFLKNNPFIEAIEWADELSAANLAAAGITDFTGDIAIAYDRNPDKFNFEMPQFFEQLAVEPKNLEFTVACHSRVAGVLNYYPLSQAILEGI